MQVHDRHISPGLASLLAPRQFHWRAHGYQIADVTTIDNIRHANFLELLASYKNLQTFADALQRSNSQISQLKNRSKHSKSGEPREIGDDMARHIEAQLGKPRGWMDQEHGRPTLPVFSEDARTLAALFDQITDQAEQDRFRVIAENYAELAIRGELSATLDALQRAWPGRAPIAEPHPADASQSAPARTKLGRSETTRPA